MGKLIDLREALANRRTFGFFDDLEYYVSGDRFTTVSESTGTIAASDARGGVVVLTTAATDNDSELLKSTKEVFKVADQAPIVFEARIQYAEAATNAANVAVGLGDALDANWLTANGGGPRTSGNQFLIYKLDGETKWRCQSRNGTGVTTNLSSKTAGGSSYANLRIEIADFDGSNCQITFFVEGEQLLDDTTGKPIVHLSLYASATEMQTGIFVMAGSATAEVLNVTYIAAYQLIPARAT